MHSLLQAAPVVCGFGVAAGGGADDFEEHAHASASTAMMSVRTSTEAIL